MSLTVSRRLCVVALAVMLSCVSRQATAQPSGGLSGSVWLPDGEPIRGAWVIARNLSDQHETRTTTNSAGEFVFKRLPVGLYRLTADISGSSRGVVTIGVSEGTVTSVPFVLAVGMSTRSLRVSVRTESGGALPGAHVIISALSGGASQSILSDHHGDVLAERVSGEPLLLVAHSPGLSGATVVPATIDSSVVLILKSLVRAAP